MFLRAVELLEEQGQKDKDLMEALHESIYKSASLPEKSHNIPPERIANIDEVLMLVSEARYNFYHGEEEKAISFLDEAKRQHPDCPEVILLDGEIHARNKNFKKARQIFESLRERPELPDWIAVEIDTVLNQIP